MKKSFFLTAICSVTLAGSAALAASPLSDLERVGRHLYMDKNLSWDSTQSCATCHHPNFGFADPTNSRDPYNTVVSLGDNGVSKGGRNAPTSAYCGYSPILAMDAEGWRGGMFWDGRATGDTLGDPLAEQAQGPPLNPVEMNMPDAATVVERVSLSAYAQQFLNAFVDLNDFSDVAAVFDNIGRAIAAYERSSEVSPFSSRFDRGTLTEQELSGLALVQANCTKCHAMDSSAGTPALFTSYRYENIGIPVNEALLADPDSEYHKIVPDLGLGGFLGDPAENGKFKVPTLRNVALTAPYSHNGYFPTLTEMVSFHNSRDVDNSWPDAEVSDNLNTTDVGQMGLSDTDIEDIVAFLHALTD